MIKIKADRRRENLFTADEVAVIIPYEAKVASHRDIVLAERAEDGILRAFSNIYAHHAVYIFLVYLLMFPFGDHSYHWSFKFENIYR